jgi:hypothetical protein
MSVGCRDCGWVLLLSAGATLLNALKPLQIDDTAYYYFAAQVAQHPLDPYGFEIFWYDMPEPAIGVLAPPVLPYWWSLAIRLFGAQPFLWKLWLLPFNLLFAAALFVLLKRWTPGLERWLLAMTLLSPTFLPGINLMLDVPAMALALCAVAVFLHACERGSVGLTAMAGIVAGLGMQTKYTAFLAPAVMLAYGVLFHRLRLAVAAAGVATAVFLGIEWLLWQRYGEFYFLYQAQSSAGTLQGKFRLTQPLLGQLGGTVPALALLGLSALGARARWLALSAGIFFIGFAAVIAMPDKPTRVTWQIGDMGGIAHLADAVFTVFGAVAAAIIGTVAYRLWHPDTPENAAPTRIDTFLLVWLALELAGYFALSPFGAVRRTMGLVVVATSIIGRRMTRDPSGTGRPFFIRVIVSMGIVLGLFFYAVDLLDACAEKHAAEQAAAVVRDKGGTVWNVGHWGFQYYAEQAAMRPVVPDESVLHAGDWLIVPDAHITQQDVDLDSAPLRRTGEIPIQDFLPVRTVSGYYGGGLPLQRFDEARLTVTIYAIRASFTPRLRSER